MSFDDLTGSYLKGLIAVFIVVDPTNPDSMQQDKLSEMLNRTFEISKNSKQIVKLLVNNSDKASEQQMQVIIDWIEKYSIPCIQLESTVRGKQIQNVICDTLKEIVDLMENNGF